MSLTDTVDVSPTAAQPTHHLSLTGKDRNGNPVTLGVIVCDRQGNPTGLSMAENPSPATVERIAQGSGGYGDFREPFTPYVQRDWSGGRGQLDFEEDNTRYNDAYRMDTRRSDGMFCGPKETYSVGITGQPKIYNPDEYTWSRDVIPGDPDPYWFWTKFVPTEDIVVTRVGCKVAVDVVSGTLTSQPTMSIWILPDDGSGTRPNTTVQPDYFYGIGRGMALSSVPDWYFIEHNGNCTYDPVSGLYTTPAPQAMLKGQIYWIQFRMGDTNCGATTNWKIRIDPYAPDSEILNRTYGMLRAAGQPQGITFQFKATDSARSFFFEYKGSEFALVSMEETQPPKMYMNGVRGLVSTTNQNTRTKLFTTGLTPGALVGGIVKITAGPGVDEAQPWRKIIANDATSITVDHPWYIPHTTATQFAVSNLNDWHEVVSTTGASTGMAIKNLSTCLAQPVTDVLVTDDIIYICMGEAAPVMRLRMAAGIWQDASVDSGLKCAKMRLIPDKNGIRKIWYLKSNGQAGYSDIKNWGVNLDFGTTSIWCEGYMGRAINMIGYSSPIQPYVIKDDCFGSIGYPNTQGAAGVWAKVPMDEMAAVKSETNGVAAIQWGVYLFFSLLNGIERYYAGRMDDIGPNRDLGLPDGRKGPAVHMISYPTGVLACIDAGADGTSSVLFWNQTGWHELYRAPMGERIRHAAIQVIPGVENPDRLWISQNERVVWIPFTTNPLQQPNYPYYSGSQVSSSRITGSMKEIVKYWHSMRVEGENFLPGHRYATLEYQTEKDGDGWNMIGTFDQSPSQELTLSPNNDVTGRWIRYRLTLYTDNQFETPVVKSVLVDGVTRVPPREIWNLTFMVADNWVNLNQDQLLAKAKEYKDLLRDWTNSNYMAGPVKVHHTQSAFDDYWAFPDGVSFQPLEQTTLPDRSIVLIGNMSLRRVG